MWRDLWIVLLVMVVFFLCLSQFEMRDTKAFNCLLREEKPGKAAPVFAPVDESPPAHVARGSLACLEDVVAFANAKRAGQDGVVGTEDDLLTIEEHLDLLGASLEANFWGGYWVYSPFFYSYEHYGSAVLTQVLVADVDEMLLLRIVPPGSSLMINTGSTERHIFPLEGVLVVSRMAPLRPIYLHATPTAAKLTASSPVDLTAYRIRPGRRVLLGVREARGAVYLEHVSTHVARAAISVFAFPSLVYGWDIGSAMTAVSALYKSLHRNVIVPLTQLLWEGEQSTSPSDSASTNSERSRRKAEQQAMADSAETQQEEAFNEARRRMQKEQQQRAKTLAPPSLTTPASGANSQENSSQQRQTQQQQQQEDEEEEEEEEDDDVAHDEL
ncbi:hypothetical protein Esti_003228 [Eimeria stiedai]